MLEVGASDLFKAYHFYSLNGIFILYKINVLIVLPTFRFPLLKTRIILALTLL